MGDKEEGAAGGSGEATTCKFFIKRPNRGRAGNRGRKRKEKREKRDSESSSNSTSSSSSSEDETTVVSNQRKRKANPLVQSTSSFAGLKSRQKSDQQEMEKEEAEQMLGVSFKSSRTGDREGPRDMGATSTIQTETEAQQDAQSIFERAQKVNEETKGKEDDRIYRGMNNYTQYVTKKDTPLGNASSGHNRQGPVRAPENIRSTVRWDYQPDLCKDYKETGFCGFGDSCKFLHDRTDYKAGWQIELEMAKGTYGEGEEGEYEIKEDEGLPFKCLICRKSFKVPIVTKCKHYFCEKCALDNYRKTTRCFVCGAQTMGIFNPAKEITKRLDTKTGKDSSDESGDEVGEDEEKEKECFLIEDNDEDVDDDDD